MISPATLTTSMELFLGNTRFNYSRYSTYILHAIISTTDKSLQKACQITRGGEQSNTSRQGPFSKDNATSNENVKRVERTEPDFRCTICRTFIGHFGFQICVRRMVDTLYLLNLPNIRDFWEKSNNPRWIETYKKAISKCMTNASRIPRSLQNFPRIMISQVAFALPYNQRTFLT